MLYRFRFDTGAYASHLLTTRVSSVGKMSSFHVKYIYIYTYIYMYIYTGLYMEFKQIWLLELFVRVSMLCMFSLIVVQSPEPDSKQHSLSLTRQWLVARSKS